MKSVFRMSEISRGEIQRRKKIAAKISCGKTSGNEICSGGIGRNEKLLRRNLNAAKIPCNKISGGEISCGEI